VVSRTKHYMAIAIILGLLSLGVSNAIAEVRVDLAPAAIVTGHPAETNVSRDEPPLEKLLWLTIGTSIFFVGHGIVHVVGELLKMPSRDESEGTWKTAPGKPGAEAELRAPHGLSADAEYDYGGEPYKLLHVKTSGLLNFYLVKCDTHDGLIGVALAKATDHNKVDVRIMLESKALDPRTLA
jgi:hypothetical protein